MKWILKPGEPIKRSLLHDQFGGIRQGGISPSRLSENIFIFTSQSGHKFGYLDGWHSDGVFHYTGKGQEGDQPFDHGNKALAEHQQTGRAVRLFDGSEGIVTYVGEFSVDEEQPFYTTDAPDKNGELRQVFMFRLWPIGNVAADKLPNTKKTFGQNDEGADCEEVNPEVQDTEQFVTSGVASKTAERREARLVQDYLNYRRTNGLADLTRLKIRPPGEARPLFTDLFDPVERVIIEAKGTVTREAIRMALGQLLDYRRFVDEPYSLAVLLPSKPRLDLMDLLTKNGVGIIYRSTRGEFQGDVL